MTRANKMLELDRQVLMKAIIDILLKNERNITDGIDHYCGGVDKVDETLERIAEEIIEEAMQYDA